ncbi:MAG TPA: class I SAM-dependent methyltransferase [Candidatus Mcinerneyibacteriales bacterium]|nr:class I SAM-dependent methyltransferase [Candidatus Mcinerneyibacteriales bacterium]
MSFFDEKAASSYDSWFETPLGVLVDKAEKDLFLMCAAPKRGEKVLDLGCGTGHYSLFLAQRGCDVIGVDISEPMLKFARKKSEMSGLSVRWVNTSLKELPFDEESFDLVCSVTAFEFLNDPRKAALKAWSLVKKGGRLVIAVIAKESPWARLYEKSAQTDKSSVFAGAHFFTVEELMELLPGVEGEYQIGLHFGPGFDPEKREEALIQEKEGVEAKKKEGGFLCGIWKKM